MSEVVENVCEQNSAQNSDSAAPSTEAIVVTLNNVDAAVKIVPDAVEAVSPAINANIDGSESKDSPEHSSTSPKVGNKKTPVKRTPSKRMSFIERAQKESEELVKNMGGSLEIEGGRRTRSSTRGTPTRSAVASTPPPVKKARNSPASESSTPTRPRARGRKLDTADDANGEEETKHTPTKKKTPAKGKKAAAKNDEEEDDVEEKRKADEEVKEAIDAETKLEEENKEKPGLPDSIIVADESKETPTSDQTQEEDKTDAVLEPVVEETLSQIASADVETTEKDVTIESENKKDAADVVLEISESVKSNSPMDTDVEIFEEKNKDKLEVQKPTPEPMEIDSSSNSDDVIEINSEATELTTTLENVQTITALNNIEKVVDTSVESSVAPPIDIVTNNAIATPVVVCDVGNANEKQLEEIKVANNDANKTSNDLCEPKIATSPPISASNDNSSVTTPQSCN